MEVQLRGLEEVKREMAQLEPRIQKNLMAGANFAVAREIRDDAKQNAPRAFGTLEDNIIAKRRRGRKGQSRASVFVQTEGKRGDPKNAFYWRFVEFGHVLKDGSWVPGEQFLTNAFESVSNRIDSVLSNYIRPRIEKALRKR